MTTLNQSMGIEQNYVVQILIVLLFILKLKIFFKIFLMMLKNWFDTSNYDKNDKRPLAIGKNKQFRNY